MPIPEAQLETWSHQGAAIGSKTTVRVRKECTRIRVSQLHGSQFQRVLTGLLWEQYRTFSQKVMSTSLSVTKAHTIATSKIASGLRQKELISLLTEELHPTPMIRLRGMLKLTDSFGADVRPGTKAINILANGSRRSADVIPAFNFRRYYRYKSDSDCGYFEGISFFTSAAKRIDNFPNVHSGNATTKHQATNGNFKPMIRIFKNIRGRLVDDGVLQKGDAPSYFIEGLLYNIPPAQFTGTYSNMVYNILKWLHDNPDHTKFVCVNERYYLLRDNDSVCWPIADGAKFIAA